MDKVALITGGRSGIGLACANRFSQNDYQVITAQRSPAENFDSIKADFSDPETPAQVIDEVIKQTGRLDVLVNNAGVMLEDSVNQMSLNDWNHTLAVNLTTPFLLIKNALPHLQAGSSIINIGSIEGLGSNPKHAAYCASKAGLHALTRAVAVDHGPQGIRCNAVAPGWIDTELNEDFIESMEDPTAFRAEIGRIHPLRRTGKPEEVATLVAWLASDDAAFVTGQIYTVDGGRLAQLPLP
ncbi:MAG: SDR family oxidoreductase [Pseudomonadota bacterium]|nr:SDR family NAD(P)-dependent oxidoreductase [Gammaproteobacteria bacterium]